MEIYRIKVLLYQDVKRLGWLGDIVEVNKSYARNYLIPQGIAKEATEGNIRSIAQAKAERAEERIKETERLQKTVDVVNGAEAVLAAKANEQGHLFGSITAKDIAANLRAQGFEVTDDVVQLVEHIKQVGTTQVTLKFSGDLTATVNVVVVPEQGEKDSTLEQDESESTNQDS